MCSPSPPPAPDYTGAAQAQGAANIDAARAQGRINNPNVIGPNGTQTVAWNGDTPTITQTLSPEQQAIYNEQLRNQRGLGSLASQGIGSLSGLIGTGLDLSGAPAAPSAYRPVAGPTALDPSKLPAMPQSAEAIRNRVIDAYMSRASGDIDKREEQVKSDLIAGGIRPGTEAYAREMDTIGRQRNDARAQAEAGAGAEAGRAYTQDLSTHQAGAADQAQQFGQQGQTGQFNAQQQGQAYSQQDAQRRQAITEMLARRQTPLNEITALMSGSQVGNPFAMPGAAQNTQVAPAPIFGATDAAGRYQTDVYNAQAGSSNAQTGALASAAAMAAMAFF